MTLTFRTLKSLAVVLLLVLTLTKPSLADFAERLFVAEPRRVVAVGDLHGDYNQSVKVLNLAGLVDAHGQWTGGDSILVQTGDFIDRGPDTIAMFQLLKRLQEQSEKVNGKVVLLYGNHELMNLQGDWRYVSWEDLISFGTPQARVLAFSSKGDIGKQLRADFNAVAIVGKTAFVHGGINLGWAEAGITHINELAHNIVQKLTDWLAVGGEGDPGLSPEERDLLSEDGPLWYRGYALKDEEDICGELKLACMALKVERMVVGHTVTGDGHIRTRCGGMLVMIDVGISRWYAGNMAALEIIGNSVHEIYNDTSKSQTASFKDELSRQTILDIEIQ